jgi:O-acetyl-ADP-ribose deacetylase (regulator of RNase III)
LLGNAYRNSLLLAVSNQARTIAFPNISTGTYRFPKRRAAEIAVREVTAFVTKDESLQVIFCCYDQQNFDIYAELLAD